jgi:hypothetical protein
MQKSTKIIKTATKTQPLGKTMGKQYDMALKLRHPIACEEAAGFGLPKVRTAPCQ